MAKPGGKEGASSDEADALEAAQAQDEIRHAQWLERLVEPQTVLKVAGTGLPDWTVSGRRMQAKLRNRARVGLGLDPEPIPATIWQRAKGKLRRRT